MNNNMSFEENVILVIKGSFLNVTHYWTHFKCHISVDAKELYYGQIITHVREFT